MGATRIHLYSGDGLSFECDDDEPTIYARSETGFTISFSLSKESDRAKLREALDAADKIAGLLEK